MSLVINQPQEGYYWRRFVRGGPKVPCRIWFGVPIDPLPDPDTGDDVELDRSPRWQAVVNGEMADPIETWHSCAGNPISREEYLRMLQGDTQVEDWKRNAKIF